ncbi:MAG TPA: hypothetical protein VMI10_20355 [Terriglobales bacterium]|nr:hypothetical protein [Terriglobales bacterium]
MTLRHAAALALVGWYLIVPPSTRRTVPNPVDPAHPWHVRTPVDETRPLSEWQKIGQFDSEHDCHRALKRLVYEGEEPGHTQATNPRKPVWGTAQCIATDDPRLKEK